jgi:exodeoxyribonuclease V alpha subunit
MITLDPSQQHAVDLACTATTAALTGGPGVGKSTCLRFALDALDARGVRCELAAPTGKAARRMFETTGREARTIHRLLEYNPQNGWGRHARRPIDSDVVIVDESSMLDVELGAALLDAIDVERTRLVFVGDADQLPPVGPGRLFGDLVDAGAVPVARLTTLHRSAAQSWIARNAPRILRGEALELGTRPDFRFVEVEDAASILHAVRRLVLEVFPRELDGVEPQLLIPQRTGVAGVDAANRTLQAVLNPKALGAPYLPRGSYELRVGDRVIHTRNDYKLQVFNGEVGEIIGIDPDGFVEVQLDGREAVTYTLEQANALQLAYALTVHRAQGSEFAWVIVVAHSTHSYMLTRQLLYTALTRGKTGVILVGDRKGLDHALTAKKPAKRSTALIERLRGEIDEVTDDGAANNNGGPR